jgi:hypothetical protein
VTYDVEKEQLVADLEHKNRPGRIIAGEVSPVHPCDCVVAFVRLQRGE